MHANFGNSLPRCDQYQVEALEESYKAQDTISHLDSCGDWTILGFKPHKILLEGVLVVCVEILYDYVLQLIIVHLCVILF